MYCFAYSSTIAEDNLSHLVECNILWLLAVIPEHSGSNSILSCFWNIVTLQESVQESIHT